jgi:alpha-beta hydrolase superfamily lysophospholipase
MMIHGMGEHFGRYGHLATFFANIGFATVGMDHRGHGRSQGKRGHVPSFNHLMDDIDLLFKKTSERFGGLPVFLYGHSLGGNLAANYVIRRKPKLQGLILSAPYFKLAFEPPKWKLIMAKAMAGIYPAFTLPTELDQTALSRDPAVVAAYQTDPLVHDKISAAFFTAVNPAGLYPIDHANELEVKTLAMHGTADRLTSPDAAVEFARNNPEMIELKLWEGFYHEIHNEKEQQQVFDYVADWLESCCE